MSDGLSRREFVGLAASLAVSRSVAFGQNTGDLKKGVLISMLPKDLPYLERFQMAKRVGFEGIEGQTVTDTAEAEQIRDAARTAGIPIHAVMNMDHWRYPFSSADPHVVDQSIDGMETSLRNAKLWGAGVVLLVPAVVTPDVPYQEAYTRSQRNVRRLIPLAEELGVVIGIEVVWNRFLYSPLEFARYVDEFDSPWVKAYFDVGNVVLFGFPQDWIRTLGERIVRIHLKDFNSQTREFVPLREGSIDWVEVRQSLRDIGYSGFLTVELPGGDENYLREVSRRVDMIIAGS
jgi:L-ribulose-5-phosphate 3-epimerase